MIFAHDSSLQAAMRGEDHHESLRSASHGAVAITVHRAVIAGPAVNRSAPASAQRSVSTQHQPMDDSLIAKLVAQNGAATKAQAVDLGETRSTIARRIRSGDWCEPLPRVVHPAGMPLDFTARLHLAHLSIRDEMAFGSSTAAMLWQLPDLTPPDRLHVVVADERNVRSTELIRVQRQSKLLRGASTRMSFPVVCREAAIVGMAPDLTFVQLVDLLQTQLSDGRTTTSRLLEWTGRGVASSRKLREAVAVAGDGHGSVWERRLAKRLRAAGLRPKAQHRVVSRDAVAYLDLAFPDARVAVEIDGYVAHSRPQEFRYDRTRQNRLVAELGWTLLRYTPYEIATRPDRVVAQIAAALARCS
jgi:very-short-patch-repair endonuclease